MKDSLKSIFNIAGKTVVVTGAGGFFGGYITKAFLDADAKVVMLGRSDRLLDQAKKHQKEYGNGAVSVYQVDFYDRKTLEATLKEVASAHDVDVLINNAYDISEKTGFNTEKGRLENSTYDQWAAAFESGIYWAVLTTQILGEGMRNRGIGSIINISSMYGLVSPNPKLYEGAKYLNPPTYGVSKAGLIALTRYTASFWGQYGVRCNAVAPGPFSNTEFDGKNSIKDGDPFLEKLKANTALKRLGHPNDLRGVLIFLASDASSYVTGQTIAVDGGWTIT